ncbi:MAG TPA: glycoside hydrolase 43 family protein [Cellvibrio sp.]|nr:glycoside hydrolase 43 family protein [Cellvibrio sp.]
MRLTLIKKLLLASAISFACFANAEPWVADLGNGHYKNPVLFADYSDPDIIKVGDDFYLVASSFNAMPGIPVLHSKDLINWTIVSHIYNRLPFEKHDRQAHGLGSWAPSINYHNGMFYVYFCTPDLGLFVATAKKPTGPWSFKHMADVELWEDPDVLWDDDGQAYLVRGKVRADILYLHKLSADGKTLLDDGKVIFKDLKTQPVIEGPKFLKRNGYYYIFAPAGGVATGWQAVLRSKSIYGPYESKVVLQQGSTKINGPHQGGMVELDSGEWWFMHFQDRGVYGRIAHLQPMTWVDDWPVIGDDANQDGIGEPVPEWKMPNISKTFPIVTPQTSDEFDTKNLGLQWQWHANPRTEWYSLNRANKNHLRLYSVQNLTQAGNLRFVPNLLLQKFSAPAFTTTTKVSFHPNGIKDKAGLVVMGKTWAYLAFYKTETETRLGLFNGTYEQYDDVTKEISSIPLPATANNEYSAILKVDVRDGGLSQFSYSPDGTTFTNIGEPFQATAGVWIGAKVGLFSLNSSIEKSSGFMDVDWFRIE